MPRIMPSAVVRIATDEDELSAETAEAPISRGNLSLFFLFKARCTLDISMHSKIKLHTWKFPLGRESCLLLRLKWRTLMEMKRLEKKKTFTGQYFLTKLSAATHCRLRGMTL